MRHKDRVSDLLSIWTAWGLSLILVWIAIALYLGQSLFHLQHSRDLVAFGAIKGETFGAREAWRLLASQWLHVKFPHMLFNALIIAGVGIYAERMTSRFTALMITLLGGTLGQYLTVLTEPQAFISGASQAYFALCGLGLVFIDLRAVRWWLAVIGIIVGFGLDLFVSDHGALKIGHTVPVVFGLLAGLASKLTRRLMMRPGL
ncbi:MAG: rhomboid family intramembrane serine protease [Asticcacaulis sp.]